VGAAFGEVELALFEEVLEQAQPVRVPERAEHPCERIEVVLGHATSI
jgi:hypothetical protein